MPTDASVLLGPLKSLLDWAQKNRMHKDQQTDAALMAINRALHASMRYVETQRGSDTPDRDRELELAEMWSEAAAKARYASEDLMNRLQDKSVYWRKELKWSREEVVAKKIDFDSVERSFNELLQGK
jgi:hypothetical protein